MAFKAGNRVKHKPTQLVGSIVDDKYECGWRVLFDDRPDWGPSGAYEENLELLRCPKFKVGQIVKVRKTIRWQGEKRAVILGVVTPDENDIGDYSYEVIYIDGNPRGRFDRRAERALKADA